MPYQPIPDSDDAADDHVSDEIETPSNITTSVEA